MGNEVMNSMFAYLRPGHNDIMGYSPVALAVMRSFDLHGTTYNTE